MKKTVVEQLLLERNPNLGIEDVRAVLAVTSELDRARGKFPKFNSLHEGYAVLAEEVDELWEEVKSKNRTRGNLAEEAMQVGAMALRFMVDAVPKANPVTGDLCNAMGEADQQVEQALGLGRLRTDGGTFKGLGR